MVRLVRLAMSWETKPATTLAADFCTWSETAQLCALMGVRERSELNHASLHLAHGGGAEHGARDHIEAVVARVGLPGSWTTCWKRFIRLTHP